MSVHPDQRKRLLEEANDANSNLVKAATEQMLETAVTLTPCFHLLLRVYEA